MKIVKTQKALKQAIRALRAQGKTIALVPTMGALHDGHVTLMRAALKAADAVAVYIFVNPRQFGPGEDLSRYPRPWKQDAALCKSEKIDILYAPDTQDVYPEGYDTTVSVGEISRELEGAYRPGHFDGVATVLAKMFARIAPDMAFFGEKDYQQLQVIRKLARDLDLPLTIVGVPTVREPDGLARSSRNAYLSEREKQNARAIYAQMHIAACRIRAGEPVRTVLEDGKAALLKAGFRKIDYFELCDSETLAPVTQLKKPARLLVAAHIGTTRLIDNIAISSLTLRNS